MSPRRRAVGALALLLGLSAPVVDALGAQGGSERAVTTAWWSRLHQSDVDLTQANPGGAPPDGLTVASAPDGATAIAALRFTLDEGEGNPVLTLQVAGTPANGDAAETVILACHAGAAWTEGAGQDWESKPPAACDAGGGGGSVTGQRSADGATWTFPLGPLQLDRVVNVVLVPGVDAEATVSPTFQVSFAGPTGDSVMTQAGSAAPSPVAPVLTAAPITASPSVAVTPAPPMPEQQTFAAALPAADQVVTATAPLVREASPLDAIAATERRTPSWVRALAILQTIVAAGLGWYLVRSAPGSDGDDTRRGLGPFVRPRLGEAPRL